jgi:hypothetical protein
MMVMIIIFRGIVICDGGGGGLEGWKGYWLTVTVVTQLYYSSTISCTTSLIHFGTVEFSLYRST